VAAGAGGVDGFDFFVYAAADGVEDEGVVAVGFVAEVGEDEGFEIGDGEEVAVVCEAD